LLASQFKSITRYEKRSHSKVMEAELISETWCRALTTLFLRRPSSSV